MKANVIRTQEDARAAGAKIVENERVIAATRAEQLRAAIKEISELDPENGSFNDIAVLFAMPEDSFIVLAPAFLESFEKALNNVNDQLTITQVFNAAGLRVEDIQKEFYQLTEQLDNELGDSLTAPKRDFAKRLIGILYNSIAQTEGISKRKITVPIEFCADEAKTPTYAHLTDSGADVYLTEDVIIHPGETKLLHTGIKVAIPNGYELQIRPKSGRSLKSKLRISNTPATIDAGYRGEICIIADNIDPVIRNAEIDESGRLYNVLWGSDITLSKGEKIAQLVLCEVPKAIYYEVDNVEAIESDGRAEKGFGSTGNR